MLGPLGAPAPGQRGQALVGVMVVMVILFALAGAVAIGASTLLSGRGSGTATSDDFRLHSAVNDSVALRIAALEAGAEAFVSKRDLRLALHPIVATLMKQQPS